MPRSGVAVSRGETDRQRRPAAGHEPHQSFVSGGFGPDESVFERFGTDRLASERFRRSDAEGESYRVEVDRYWRRTAGRRAAAEARRADGLARADRALARAREAERAPERAPADPGRAPAAFERAVSASDPHPVSGLGPVLGGPYREQLHAWARETAQEPPAASGRRTVSIKGHGAEGYTTRNGTRASAAERHLQLPRHERSGFQPDRVAMWAVLLAMVMVLIAAASSHAAVLAHHIS